MSQVFKTVCGEVCVYGVVFSSCCLKLHLTAHQQRCCFVDIHVLPVFALTLSFFNCFLIGFFLIVHFWVAARELYLKKGNRDITLFLSLVRLQPWQAWMLMILN